MVTFLWPQTWLLYAASALLGVGAAIIWTGIWWFFNYKIFILLSKKVKINKFAMNFIENVLHLIQFKIIENTKIFYF